MSKQFCNDFKNDVLFKYLLCDDLDPDCIFMLKLFIENILNIKCHQITVLNPDLNPKYVNDKDMVLDIKVKTTSGDIIDIEMQNSTFSKSHYCRFQQYGATLLASQKENIQKQHIQYIRSSLSMILIRIIWNLLIHTEVSTMKEW